MPFIDLIRQGVPAWDAILLGSHAHPLFYSVAIPLLASVLARRFGRSALACGFAVGVASLLFHEALFGLADVQLIPNLLWGSLDVLWLLVNGALALVVASVISQRSV